MASRSFVWLLDAWKDIGYGGRTLRKTPGFTAVAIITLALGIGSVTVIYSVVRNVLLDPFPYPHSDRMVDVVVRDASNRILRGALPAPEFLDYQEQSRAFEDVMGTIVEEMLWNTSPHDPVTLVAAISIVGVIGMCACLVPARRAIRVDPITALRHE